MKQASIQTVTVEDIAAPEDGAIAIGPFGSSMKADLYTERGVPVIRGNNIGRGKNLVGEFVYVGDETADRLKRAQLKEGDIFFPHRGAIGEVGIVTNRVPLPALMSTSLMRLRVDLEVADPEYIFWFFKSDSGRHEIMLYASTVGTPGIGQPLTSLRSMRVPLPPLAEQREIAAILGALDDKIELNRKTAATLEAMARALYRSWFVDFDPVHAKAEGRAPAHMDAATAALFPDRFGDDGLPDGWCVETVDNVFDVVMGQSPPGETYNDDGIGLPFYQGRTDFGFRFPTRRKFCSAPSRVAMRDSVLLSVRAPVGDLNRAWEDCCIGRGVASLSEKRQRNAYGYEALWALSDELKSFDSEGTVFGSINRKQLLSLTVIQPSAHLVDVFEERVLPMDRKIRNITEQIQTLAALRDTLLPRLMSGELRVGEAREHVEAVA